MRQRIVDWTLKGLAAAALSLGLSACNLVVTTEPTFAPSDAAGAPVLREGLWANIEGECDVDLSKPADSWPECADSIVVRDSAMTGKGKDGKPFTIPFVLAAGDPRVMQIDIDDPDTKAKLYIYLGVKPRSHDDKGRITAYSGWVVQCGPPPPKDAKRANGQPRYGSLKPTPGMIMDDEDSGCKPSNKAALTRAAKASEHYEESGKDGVSRWVRDGDK